MNTSAQILSLADRCVKCGLCLPQCPTYVLTKNENESPRGRIALIQGWLTGQLEATETLTRHLDQCLLCRRCERVCPSAVAYGDIMDQSKALLRERIKVPFSFSNVITNFSLKLILNQKISPFVFSTLRLLQNIGVFRLMKKSGLNTLFSLQRLMSYLPKLSKQIKTKNFYPANKSTIKNVNVALFTGCLSKQLDATTVNATINVLNHLGYGVYVPKQQVCCGALDLHNGNKIQAENLALKNTEAFNQQKNITAVVSIVNGCTSQLREYPKLNTKSSFTPPVLDIIEFLSEIDWPKDIKFNPLNRPVALQIPCSLQNSLRAEDKLLTLLHRIPGMKLPPNNIYNKCCGAAGSYFLHFPKLSDQLKNLAVENLEQSLPEMIISSNLGCALQLQSALSLRNEKIEVIHPIKLLEQQLQLS